MLWDKNSIPEDFADNTLRQADKFLAWRNGKDSLQAAKFLETLPCTLAQLRAASLYYGAANPAYKANLMKCIRSCLRDKDIAIRTHAKAILALSYCAPDSSPYDREAVVGVSSLDSLINSLTEMQSNDYIDDFYLETEALASYAISEIFITKKEFNTAKDYASNAVLIASSLNIPRRVALYRFSYALALMRNNETDVARNEFENLVNSKDGHSYMQHVSAVNFAHTTARLGDVRGSLEYLHELREDISETTPDIQLLQSILGIFDPLEKLDLSDDGLLSNFTQAIRNLWQYNTTLDSNYLNQAVAELKTWQPLSDIHSGLYEWIHAYALFHLEKPYLSFNRLSDSIYFDRLSRTLILGVQIELALLPKYSDLGNLLVLSQKFITFMEEIQEERYRDGLLEILALWHPAAAAFIASTPHSLKNQSLSKYSFGYIFKNGRPISIHGNHVSSRIPFIQKSLEAFGLEANIDRDQSTEQGRLNEVLLIPWGEGIRRLPIVSPALIVFNLLRAGENHDYSWNRMALELLLSNGTIPKTSARYAKHLEFNINTINQGLLDVIEQKIKISDFQDMIK